MTTVQSATCQEGEAKSSLEYRRALTALMLVVAAFISLSSAPVDDALRHVGLAFAEHRSWGEVYPHSVFSQYPGYDPWWGFDLTLRRIAELAGILPLPRLTMQFLAVKTLSFALLAAFLLLAVRRAGVPREVRSPAGLVAAAALVGLFLAAPIARVLTVRPFILGTLYLLLALPGGGAVRGALSAGALAFFYPYLFWIYTLPVAAAHLVRGDRSYGAAAVAATVAAVAVQPADFWGLLRDLARSEAVRALIDVKITEFSPATQEPLLALLVILPLVCAMPFLPAASRRIGVPHLLMLFFAPAAVKYVRYLIDVELTMLFVVCAGGLLPRWIPVVERIGAFWEHAAHNALARLPVGRNPDRGRVKVTNLRPWIGLGATALAVIVGLVGLERQGEYRDLEHALETIPPGSLVLTEFNPQYALLYVRPDLRLVPSCEIGFPAEAIRKPYIHFLNEGDPCALAAAVGADRFVSAGGLSLALEGTRCLERVDSPRLKGRFRSLALWKTTASP